VADTAGRDHCQAPVGVVGSGVAVGAVGVGDPAPVPDEPLEVGVLELDRVVEQHRQVIAELATDSRVGTGPGKRVRLGHPDSAVGQMIADPGMLDHEACGLGAPP